MSIILKSVSLFMSTHNYPSHAADLGRCVVSGRGSTGRRAGGR